MKEIKLNIPADIKVEFLPTKRHRDWRVKLEKINTSVSIKELSDEEFPVVFRVTDYSAIIKDIKKEDFDKLSDDEVNKLEDRGFHKEELRYFDGKVFAPYHINLYGTLNSTLVHEGTEKALEEISYNFRKSWIDTYEANLYDETSSVINIPQRTFEINQVGKKSQELADKYIQYDGKLWREIGEPYYLIQHFGMTSSPAAFIGYALKGTLEEQNLTEYKKGNISKNKYSCLHGDVFSEQFKEEVLLTKKYDKALDYEGSEIVKENIEVLHPEIVRFKDFMDLEKENLQNLSFEELINKDVAYDTLIIKELNTPDAVSRRFNILMYGILDEQIRSEQKPDPKLAAFGVYKLLSDNEKSLLNQYFVDNNIKSKADFDEYFKKEFGNHIWRYDINHSNEAPKVQSKTKKSNDLELGR